MVKLRDVTITFFVTKSFYDSVMAETAREFLPGEEYLSSRVRYEPGLCLVSIVLTAHLITYRRNDS